MAPPLTLLCKTSYSSHRKEAFADAKAMVIPMKHFSLILAALLIGAAAVSCGDSSAKTDPKDTAVNTGDTNAADTAAEEENFDPFAGLPDKDYGGHDFRMLIRPYDRWIEDMYVEEATGDAVDDAVFERNSMVSEKYNVVFSYQQSSDINYETDGIKSILANEDAFDLIVSHARASIIYANQKLLLDWKTELPYVNLKNEWWDQDAQKSLSINNKLYVMTGDISHCSMGAANLMLFNKPLFESFDMEYPYQLVKDGKWTYEVWESMVKEAVADLDGNGVMEKDHDRYGYVTQKWVGPVQAFATSGLRVLEKDKDDIPYISFMSDKTQDVFTWYFDIIDSDAAYVDVSDVSYSADFITIFNEGRSLFIDMNMHDVIGMRSMDADFGIVPWPKYDESSEYCTNVDAGTNMCIVPMTASDPERTSIILESLCAIGSKKVIPAYFDVALQTKASRDNDSAEMLNIVKAARIYDLGYYNTDASGAFSNEFVNFIDNKSRNLASFYEKNVKNAQKSLEKILKPYLEE